MIRTVVTAAAALAALLAGIGAAEPALAQGPGSMSGGYMNSGGGPGMYSDEFASGWSSGPGGCGCDDGSCSSCDIGCGDECGYSGDTGAGGLCSGCLGGQPRWYFYGDYLYVRASFSEAVAYIEETDDGIGTQGNIVHELNFQHESSYRVGGGYRLGCCDEELRFTYTRFNSGADAIAPQGSLVPYEVIGPDGPTFINADVDVNSFDLDYRKTIPLGGPACCECSDSCDPCGDPCGCGDACCGPSCPAWDITWSGGVRFANVDWNRQYATFFSDGDVFRRTNVDLDFKGGGPRFGLEGRRYFGANRWCSAYVKGDISLLLGQMNQRIRRAEELGVLLTLDAQGRRLIPVTEIEAGLSTQLTNSARFSAGYLFSAWHDLGFRDQFDIQTVTESNSTDTANILGFDGFFARVEFGW